MYGIAKHINCGDIAVIYIILKLTRNTFCGTCTCSMSAISNPIIQISTV